MQARLIKPAESRNPNYDPAEAERCRKAGELYAEPCFLVLPAGTVIDHPDAFRLVQMGKAEPADDACRNRAGMTEAAFAKAVKEQDLLSRGMGRDLDAEERKGRKKAS